MKLGTEDKKKVWILGGLSVVALYFFYTNVLSGPGSAPAPTPAPIAATAPAPAPVTPSAPAPAARPSIQRASIAKPSARGGEFHPVLRSKRAEERIDPATVDPTLRNDLLAKVQGVTGGDGLRNIFQFGAPPALQATAKKLGPEPKVLPIRRVHGAKTFEEYDAEVRRANTPAPTPPKVVTPVTFKYYGFAINPEGGMKTAFFMDGEDILVASEGQLLKKRYKVVRILVNSVMVEDTTDKERQSLPLQADLAG